ATRAMPSVWERAARRRGGRGSLGMATEGLVDGRDHGNTQSIGRPSGEAPKTAACSLKTGCYGSEHIAVHVQRGGGTGPMKPRQPPLRREGANSWRRVAQEAPLLRHTPNPAKNKEFPQWLSPTWPVASAGPSTTSPPSTCARSASGRWRSS